MGTATAVGRIWVSLSKTGVWENPIVEKYKTAKRTNKNFWLGMVFLVCGIGLAITLI
jgi:hypothetical protein